MKNKIYSWKIGGEAGFGIMVTGNTFTRLCARANLEAFGYSEYPSLIRGGYNSFQVDFSETKTYSVGQSIDLLVALNKQTIDFSKKQLKKNSIIIFDPENFNLSTENFDYDITLIPIPFLRLVNESGGDELMKNTAALGASAAILGFPFLLLEHVLSDQFAKKGEKVIVQNVNASKIGYEYVKDKLKFKSPFLFKTTEQKNQKITVTLNEALGFGAIAANCKFFSAYPMTPINGLLTFMANCAEKCGFIYKQPEDEIAGINMAIGASLSGSRSMVATSGGGFALMSEAYGMAGMMEVPLVVILGQRPGPSSGLPTWTSQGDLQFALNASQGDFPKIVLAPGDNDEAFDLTVEAFNLADIFQTPVIVLVDKFLCESPQVTSAFSFKNVKINRGEIILPSDFKNLKEYKRYKITENGISKRAFVGTKGPFFVSDSYEHDEYGFSTEDADTINSMMLKRDKKRENIEKIVPDPKIYGNCDADLSFVGWGSTKLPMLRAIEVLNDGGFKVNYLHLNYLSPFPTKFLTLFAKKAKFLTCIEGNISGQLTRLIAEKTGILIKDKYLKFDGRPFFPEEIVKFVKEKL